MHLRFSSARGLPILETGSPAAVAWLYDIVIHPDTAAVEGYLVLSPSMSRAPLFLAAQDIVRWGTAVLIRDHRAIGPLDEIIRLQSLLAQHRPVVGQRVSTESGKHIGKCVDVQIDTDASRVEWLFVKKWFRNVPAIPVTEILEVTTKSIVIEEPAKTLPVTEEEVVLQSVVDLAETAVPTPS